MSVGEVEHSKGYFPAWVTISWSNISTGNLLLWRQGIQSHSGAITSLRLCLSSSLLLCLIDYVVLSQRAAAFKKGRGVESRLGHSREEVLISKASSQSLVSQRNSLCCQAEEGLLQLISVYWPRLHSLIDAGSFWIDLFEFFMWTIMQLISSFL